MPRFDEPQRGVGPLARAMPVRATARSRGAVDAARPAGPSWLAAVRVGAWLSAVALSAGCADDGGPRLDAASPAAARRDSTVTLTGRRLCGAGADCAHAAGEVELGLALPAVRAVVVSYSDVSAQIVIPTIAPVGATQLVVTVGARSSNALDFEVLP